MISGKEQIIAKMHLQLKASTFAAFHVVVACEAIVFLVATSLHVGAFGVPQLNSAMIVEGLCGEYCVLSAYAAFTCKHRSKKAALIV